LSKPSDANFQGCAAGADWSKTFYQVLTRPGPARTAVAITGADVIMIARKHDKPAQAVRGSEVLRMGVCERDQMGRRS